MFIFWIQQSRMHLAVVNIVWGNSIPADEPMIDIDANAVFVSVLIDVILFIPASV